MERVKYKDVKMAKNKVNKKQASSVQLSSNKPQDVKSIDNLQALQKALPACSDITAAARYLCETVAPKESERFLALKTA